MKLGFYSTLYTLPWGGSEELWSTAAARLLSQGHGVVVSYPSWPTPPAPLEDLRRRGATVHVRRRPGPLSRLLHCASRSSTSTPIERWLRHTRPDLLLFTLDWHVVDPAAILACRRLGVPYALNVQVVSENHWIDGAALEPTREAFLCARRCFFVSRANRELLEMQLGCELPNAEVVDNPFKVRWDARPPWPRNGPPWRLAVVGRLNCAAKGQDLVLRALRAARWAERPLEVRLWGPDHGSAAQIREMVSRWNLARRVQVMGVARDIEALWAEHHGLLLPSRFEGCSLAVVEAMLCARPVVVTPCGRNPDLVDEQTGVLLGGPSLDCVEEGLERAWARRSDWEAMGRLAAARLRERYTPDPPSAFAGRLVALASGPIKAL